MSFMIYDSESGRPYVHRSWKTREVAEAERATLLRFYPDDSEWRRRLHVAEGEWVQAAPTPYRHRRRQWSEPPLPEDATAWEEET